MSRTLFILLMLAGLAGMAQEEIMVKVQVRPSSFGLQPSFEVEIPQASVSDAIGILEKILDPPRLFRKNKKLEKQNDEWMMQEITVRQICPDPINVFAQASSFPGRIFVRLFFQDNSGFIGVTDTTDAMTDAASLWVRNYALEVYRDAVEKELDKEEGVLKSLEKDLRSGMKQQGSTLDRINRLVSDNAGLIREIAELEIKIMQIRDPETYEMQGTGIRHEPQSSQEDEKKLSREIRSNKRRLSSNENMIKRLERRVRSGNQQHDELILRIEQQKQKVDEIKARYRNIR